MKTLIITTELLPTKTDYFIDYMIDTFDYSIIHHGTSEEDDILFHSFIEKHKDNPFERFVFLNAYNSFLKKYADVFEKTQNVFVPHMDVFLNNTEIINHIHFHEIWCQTQFAYNYFQKHYVSYFSSYIGSSLPDLYFEPITNTVRPKQNEVIYFHRAGGSLSKQTDILIDTWIDQAMMDILAQPMLIISISMKTFLQFHDIFQLKYNYVTLTIRDVVLENTIQVDNTNLYITHHKFNDQELKTLYSVVYASIQPSCYEETEHFLIEPIKYNSYLITQNSPPMNQWYNESNCVFIHPTENLNHLRIQHENTKLIMSSKYDIELFHYTSKLNIIEGIRDLYFMNEASKVKMLQEAQKSIQKRHKEFKNNIMYM